MGRGDARVGAQVGRPARLALSSAGHRRALVHVDGHEAFDRHSFLKPIRSNSDSLEML